MRMFAVALLVALSGSFFSASQTTRPVTPGVVVGRVVIETGAAVAGATVELLRDGVVAYRAATNSNGEFEFKDVLPGSYMVRASHQAFAPNTHPTIAVDSQSPVAPVTLKMRAAPLKELRREDHAAPAASVSESVMVTSGQRAAGLAGAPAFPYSPRAFNTEAYDYITDNRFRRAITEPVSTFSIDVDTASYSNVRRFLGDGRLPPADAVRSEELVNYFRFDYPTPKGSEPFSVTTEIVQCPWNPRNRLALIGLQSRKIEHEETPPRNLVFLLDVSGSMMPANKLPLVKAAMKMLTDTMRSEDRVAIVVYAGASGLALPSTPGNHKAVIQNAIADLRAGGSTNGASGIRLAYNVAADNFIKGGVNRVILATDGDFNVGVTSQGELVRLIEEQRERSIFLSVIGVGTGNLKDSTMEKLADTGNGNYSYFDTLHEARRVLIAEGGATLVTVAKDVKIQVEFNPAKVGAYRLIGYENRLLNREDFNDDRKDAGEIGAGHAVTALYEIVPPGERIDGPDVDRLKYQGEPQPNASRHADELMTVKLRYKQPDGDRSELMTVPVKDRTTAISDNIGFAAAVAEFGMLLRRSEFLGKSTWESARALAVRHRGDDSDGYRAEFIRMLDLAAALDHRSDGEGSR